MHRAYNKRSTHRCLNNNLDEFCFCTADTLYIMYRDSIKQKERKRLLFRMSAWLHSHPLSVPNSGVSGRRN